MSHYHGNNVVNATRISLTAPDDFWSKNKMTRNQTAPPGSTERVSATRTGWKILARISLFISEDHKIRACCIILRCFTTSNLPGQPTNFCSDKSPQSHTLISGLNFYLTSAWVWLLVHCPSQSQRRGCTLTTGPQTPGYIEVEHTVCAVFCTQEDFFPPPPQLIVNKWNTSKETWKWVCFLDRENADQYTWAAIWPPTVPSSQS